MGLVIIFIFSPYAMADIGLWMSFVATLGIILSSELTSKMKFHIKKKKFYQRVLILIAVSFIITISSTIAISVFLWLFFGEISLISPLTNIIFTPLMSLVILFGLMSIALGGIPLLSEFISFVLILPNWSVTYDGLGRLPWMKDHFKAVTLTHAYTCKYAIGSYGSYSTWVPAQGESGKMIGFVRDVTTDQPIPSSAYDISNVTITEAFSPLIGLNMTMKNSLSLKAEYRKQRNLALNVTSVQLTEGHTSEFVVGAGYTIKNLNFITKKKDGGQKKVSNDLKLQVDVSYKDVKMLLRKIDEGITQASSGNKVLAIKISADYVLSQKINLQLFYDHQGTTPLISSSYPVKADNVGLNIKLMLTR